MIRINKISIFYISTIKLVNWFTFILDYYLFNIKTDPQEKITVFTTRPDTLFGVTYLAISVNHSLIKNISDQTTLQDIEKLKQYLKKHKNNELEKIGIKTSLIAINPVNSEPVPIWVASYVLDEYGTGAVMGVPAHDLRDFEFAKKIILILNR